MHYILCIGATQTVQAAFEADILTCMHYAQTISWLEDPRAPSSTIELLKGFLATCDSPAGHFRRYHEIEQYGLPVQGVVPFPQHYTTSCGRWHLEEGHMVHKRSTT